MATSGDPLGGNPLGGSFNPLGGMISAKKKEAQKPKEKLEVQLKIPDQYKNVFIENLCKRLEEEKVDPNDRQRILDRNKCIQIISMMNKDEVNMEKLRILIFSGVPENTLLGLRPVVWRIMFNCFPTTTSDWQKHLDQNYESYEGFKKELIVKPKVKDEEMEKERAKYQAMMDHPLSTSQTSIWNTFFKDQEIWDEIEKDIKRTRTDMRWFCRALDESMMKSEENLARLERQADTKKADLKPEDTRNYIDTHSDVMSRVLFIYAKLNPGIKYVQGMNEVLAVIYYCYFVHDDYMDRKDGG